MNKIFVFVFFLLFILSCKDTENPDIVLYRKWLINGNLFDKEIKRNKLISYEDTVLIFNSSHSYNIKGAFSNSLIFQKVNRHDSAIYFNKNTIFKKDTFLVLPLNKIDNMYFEISVESDTLSLNKRQIIMKDIICSSWYKYEYGDEIDKRSFSYIPRYFYIDSIGVVYWDNAKYGFLQGSYLIDLIRYIDGKWDTLNTIDIFEKLYQEKMKVVEDNYTQ